MVAIQRIHVGVAISRSGRAVRAFKAETARRTIILSPLADQADFMPDQLAGAMPLAPIGAPAQENFSQTSASRAAFSAA